MNQPVAIVCPNCGAGLGPAQGDEYVCVYCSHRSRMPRAYPTAAEQQAALGQALARFEQQRARATRERTQLRRDAVEAKRRENAIVMLGIGGLFLLFALGFGALAVRAAVTTGRLDGAVLGLLGFGAFWVVLGGGLFLLGLRFHGSGVRERDLRARGTAGRATITSWHQTHLVLDGNPRIEMVLRVELPGYPPIDVKHAEYVPRMACVATGAELPVFVDPKRPSDVLIDWWSASAS